MIRVLTPLGMVVVSFLQQAFYSQDKVIDTEGFDKIVIGAGADRDNFAVGIIQSRNDQNRRMLERYIFAQHPAQPKAVGWRHHEIEEETLRKAGMGRFHCLCAIVYDDRFVPLHFEYLCNER